VIEAHHKIPSFVDTARTTITALKTHDRSQLTARCQAAATHNQQLLAEMKRTWTTDFESWLNHRIT
jgi:hypothetical protein